ncbi:hypothetical protein Glove_130g3 [Diversispora epigaea]|uniref:Uncharacterized protein n=1 Tax=Diversispora epigaea TaxID=1348612 RepID=A0A397J6X3_9GLOM|nr:hypothetical protein Glove_130g3 [Diversispora epigaea]
MTKALSSSSTIAIKMIRTINVPDYLKWASLRESFEECGIHYTPQYEIDKGMFCLSKIERTT